MPCECGCMPEGHADQGRGFCRTCHYCLVYIEDDRTMAEMVRSDDG